MSDILIKEEPGASGLMDAVVKDENPHTEPLDEDALLYGAGEDYVAPAAQEATTTQEDGGDDNDDDDDEENENPLALDDSEDDEDEIQVTIGDVQPTNFSFQKQVGQAAARLDIDQTPLLEGQTIYDLDLSQMQDTPWRKPGADINDYFNYGFTEETWNTYCERQKKLRAEYNGNQGAANKAYFGAMTLQNPLATISRILPTVVPTIGTNVASMGKNSVLPTIVVKAIPSTPAPITVSMASTIPDFSRPPPIMGANDAPPGMNDGAPGTDSMKSSDLDKSILTPSFHQPPPVLDMSMPPPSFNPALPPPSMMGTPGSTMPMFNMSMPPPGINLNTPNYANFGQQGNQYMGSGSMKQELPPGIDDYGGGPSMDDDRRRPALNAYSMNRRRSRSRSRSPGKRRRESRDDERKHRRHRSRSRSGSREGRRKTEKRERKDDDRDRRRRRRDEDEDEDRGKDRDRKRSRRDREEGGGQDYGDDAPPGL